MSTGQVSVWVPLVAAALGIIGVVAGQLVNAWREDRRWRRDKKHEVDSAWHSQRLDTYCEFLLRAEACGLALRAMHAKNDDAVKDGIKKMRESVDELSSSLMRVRLMGTADVASFANGVWAVLLGWMKQAIKPDGYDYEFCAAAFAESLKELTKIMRKEFSLSDVATHEMVSVDWDKFFTR